MIKNETLNFIGPIPPMITPFDQNGNIDLIGHIGNVKHWVQAGLGGLLVLGSNSETVFLEEDEKLSLIENTVDHAGDLPVLAGTGLESIRGTIRLTNLAAKAGAKAALVLTPSFYKGRMNTNALVHYFKEVADHSQIPILIYNVTKYTGVNISLEAIHTLSQHENIIGMKDSSGSVGQLVLFQSVAGNNFQILPGSASIWLPALQLGAKSAIMALANCAPSNCVEIQANFDNGSMDTATAIYRKMVVLNQAITATFGIAGLKYACAKLGLNGGVVRKPLMSLTESQQKKMDEILKETILAS